MSIYASIPGIDDDGPCGPPWAYRGSHILPTEDDPRGGSIGLAIIPSHITPDGRDDQPEDGTPWPWLRLSIDGCDDSAVLLTPAQARYLAQQLTTWADSASDPTEHDVTDRHSADTINDDELDRLYADLNELTELTRGQSRRIAEDHQRLHDAEQGITAAVRQRKQAEDRARRAERELATMTHAAKVNGEGHRHAYQAYQAALRIVSAWCVEANETGGIDAGDLAWRLHQAGHPLPDDEESEVTESEPPTDAAYLCPGRERPAPLSTPCTCGHTRNWHESGLCVWPEAPHPARHPRCGCTSFAVTDAITSR